MLRAYLRRCALALQVKETKSWIEVNTTLYKKYRVANSDWLKIVKPTKANSKKAAKAAEAKAKADEAKAKAEAKTTRSRRKKIADDDDDKPAKPVTRPACTRTLFAFQHELLAQLFGHEGPVLVSGYRLVGCVSRFVRCLA